MAQDFPWPVSLGSHLRLSHVVDVLSGLGPTDLFAFVPARRTESCALPPGLDHVRLKTVVRPPPTWSATRRLSWLTSRGLPLELALEDPTLPRRAFDAWRADAYDVAWFSKAATFALLGRPRLGPTIVDFDDLEDYKIRSRLAALRSDGAVNGIGARARHLMTTAQATLNAARWSHFQRSLAGSVQKVVLCSELDARRAGFGNVSVVPNGYDTPVHPLGRALVADPPTFLLAGSFGYPPNADAANFFVSSILPKIREHQKRARLRLVGEASDAVTALDAVPDVDVVGWVPSMDDELAHADVVVVPLRYGSGTRVKILEAAAHRIPIVSTTLGAEGLGFEDGTHLLLADTAEGFASACLRLLSEPQLRQRLVDEAQRTFLAHFQWTAATDRMRDLVGSVAHHAGSPS